MPEIVTSIIIPVFNHWNMTENCLRSLQATLPALPENGIEIIVVDNASTDATPAACPALGQSLFGENFLYRRSETNLNFGPASNLGARLARGRHLLMLNNDTIALPGWYEPLLDDFSSYPNLAASGPLLMYPGSGPLGDTVQHLGVMVTPTLNLGHLYEGIAAASPLAKTRRFFQVITAACLLVPRQLFLAHGGFDESYINGGEDIDLCARLWQAGYRMTVNPASRLYHLAGQTPGRHDHDQHNSARLCATSLKLLTPDWHIHLQNDGLELGVSAWGTLCQQMPPDRQGPLPDPSEAGSGKIAAGLIRQPLWFAGYAELINRAMAAKDFAQAHSLLLSYSKIRPLPEVFLQLAHTAEKTGDSKSFLFSRTTLAQSCMPFADCVKNIKDLRAWLADIGLENLAGKLDQWLLQLDRFAKEYYQPFMAEMEKCGQAGNLQK